MTTNTYAEPALHPENAAHGATRPCSTAADATLEFGRFRVLLRQRQLIADGAPIELGTRAFELLLALLEADGALVTKDELMSRGWPGIFIAEGQSEDSDPQVAQGSWRRPRFDPHGIRPRVPVYCRGSRDYRWECS